MVGMGRVRTAAGPRVVVVALLGAAGLLGPGSARGQVSELNEPFAPPCGKAAAMARQLKADLPADVPADGPLGLEAMEETDVLHCDLDIEVSSLNPSGNSCTITGSNRMTIQSKSATLTTFTFRLRNQYTITSALINDVTPVSVSTLNTTTRVATLDRAYAMDEVFTLTIAYTGTTFSAGFGSIEVTTQGGTPVVASLSEPYYAYTWWPAKDGDVGVPGDNSDKFTLDFSITAPSNYEVPANGTLVSVDSLGGGRNRYNWSSTNPIATYLVAFAATNYNTWTATYNYPGGSMPVQFFIYPSNDSSGNRLAWEQVLPMLSVFGAAYGPYPFLDEKYGIYNFPFGGGMEHQTMTGQSGFSESLSAHELAHQWWGDAVTCETWSDIWLNEGFATFSECLWAERENGISMPAYHSCMAGRRPGSVGDSVYVYPSGTASVSRIFSSTYSYRKAAWVLHMLRGMVGDPTFFQILADYRANFEDSTATTDDFAAVASTTYGQDLTYFFDQWVYQIGAPSYRYGWDTAKVEGQDYLLLKIEQVQGGTYPAVFEMPVQVDVIVNGIAERLTVWNDERTQWFALPVDNTATGVTFDPQTWILWTSATPIGYVGGDLDNDQDVDPADYAQFTNCYTGEGEPVQAGCQPVDFDGDQDVDCLDWGAFVQAWTAIGEPTPFPACSFSIEPLAVTTHPHGAVKNRFITFQANPLSAGAAHGIQVSHPGSGGAWYISTPRTSPPEVLGQGISFLVSDAAPPLYDFTALPVVHVSGCAIAPGQSYEVRGTQDGVNFSAPLTVSTTAIPSDGRWWADVSGAFSVGGDVFTLPPTPANAWRPSDGAVNGSDVLALLRTFEEDPTAPPMTWADLGPEDLDRTVNGSDVLRVVNAFAVGTGREFYPFAVPAAPGPQGQPACPPPPLEVNLLP